MDRIWQWAWDRYAPRYSWAVFVIAQLILLPVYLLLSVSVISIEQSSRYLEAAAVAVGVVLLQAIVVFFFPGLGSIRLREQSAAGDHVDEVKILEDTYRYARRLAVRLFVGSIVGAGVLLAIVGALAGASGSLLFHYWLLGAVIGVSVALIGVHSLVEGSMRPARVVLAGDTGIGDSLPRSRPTFATWSVLTVLGVAFSFSIAGAMLTAVFHRASELPILWIVIGSAMTFGIALPITVGAGFSQSLRPIRDLAEGTKRVAAGDYSRRLPVVQDDDLGALAASFNRMQAGLAERQRLQAAFGTYVDPSLAARLLEQGDDVFTGERREVTVMFVDVRDFTPFAEANTAEDTVARLNALFEIVVPAVVDAGGHVNKFLGDGALAVFGAPNDLADHADSALNAAVQIHRRVAERFDGELRIGIGINTGTVIAGTIGGGSKLEFTLIGDTVNVAARVEQLTKATSDAILLTNETVDALASKPSGLLDRGSHELKGKSAAVQLFGVRRQTAATW